LIDADFDWGEEQGADADFAEMPHEPELAKLEK
jgi:hypothetical protein